ncbi:PadR family transcriptional regulator [Bacillus sp. 165]|uniref:PadR family transcriptional regulator n=1 Tax=Bacillus sp. 165 TaxID=1529117 RepID=UPI001ADC6D91|nr:PadR family transcriptional regulator [Bacillus sp. 165]MBO9128789.1 PadR family transcriptional regulator [Bacillus sp. 165]
MEMNKEMLKGYIDTIILSMIYRRDMYGYELSKSVKEESKNSFEIKEGTLYLALKRLETNGYAQSYWDESVEGGRRKYYKITDEGKTVLEEKKDEWTFFKTIMDHFLKGVTNRD